MPVTRSMFSQLKSRSMSDIEDRQAVNDLRTSTGEQIFHCPVNAGTESPKTRDGGFKFDGDPSESRLGSDRLERELRASELRERR